MTEQTEMVVALGCVAVVILLLVLGITLGVVWCRV